MKNSKIWSLILSFFFTVGLYGFSLAQNPTNSKVEDKERSWTAGKTSVSELSPEQRKKLLGLKLPEGYWEMWEKLPKFEPVKGVTLPTRFDWRDSNMVTPVKNQGNCGSCWLFAAVGALESMVKIYGEVEMDLSEQQVLSCKAYGTGCDGGYPEIAYELFQSPGAAKEECMPYQASDQIPCADDTCEKWAKISNYYTVSNNVNAIKNAIYTHGPVSTLMAVRDVFSSYTGGCFNDDIPYILNHVVMLIGWDDTICNGQGAWIGKNSWGTGWGMQGFFYIKYDFCQIGSGTEFPNYIFHRPYVRLEDYEVNDSAGGDGDGIPEPGETVRLDFALKNVWSLLSDVSVTVAADPADIIITDNYSYLGIMASKEIKNNSSDPMQFWVPINFPSRRVDFTFHVSGDSGAGVIYTADTTVGVWVVGQTGQPRILLVDDDPGDGAYGNRSFYIAAFDSLNLVYDVLDKEAQGSFPFSLSNYQIVIWYTGDHRDSIFSQADVESLMSFLDHGGRLFLTSQDAVEVLSVSPEPLFQQFLTDYLHTGYGGTNNKWWVMGYPGDEVGDSLLIRHWGGANNQISVDNLVPDSLADTVLVYADVDWNPSNLVAATKYGNDTTFKVVVFGFGFEGITGYYTGGTLSQPHIVMQRVLNWLGVPSTGPPIPYSLDTIQATYASMAITNYGAIGDTSGQDFVWNGTDQLWDGSLILAWVVPGDTMIAIDMFNHTRDSWYPHDSLIIRDTTFGQFATTAFIDIIGLGSEIEQYSVGSSDSLYGEFILQQYVIKNLTDTTIHAYVSLCLDWDIFYPETNNDSYGDSVHNLAWHWCPSQPKYKFGVMRLPTDDNPVIGYEAVSHRYYIYPQHGWRDDQLWQLITKASWQDDSSGYDLSLLMTPGMITLPPDSAHLESFIIFGVDTTQHLIGPAWWHPMLSFCGFYRGEVNGDRNFNASDVVYLINYLYMGGPAPPPFPDQGDVNNDDVVNAADVVYLINYLFMGGPSPTDKNRFLPEPWRGKFVRRSLCTKPNW